MSSDWMGWAATVTFTASYFAKDATKLRRVQAAAAVLWLSYGIAIHAVPVIASNAIVTVAAIYSALKMAKDRNKNNQELLGS